MDEPYRSARLELTLYPGSISLPRRTFLLELPNRCLSALIGVVVAVVVDRACETAGIKRRLRPPQERSQRDALNDRFPNQPTSALGRKIPVTSGRFPEAKFR